MARIYSRKDPWRISWQFMRYIEGVYRCVHHYFTKVPENLKYKEKKESDNSLGGIEKKAL